MRTLAFAVAWLVISNVAAGANAQSIALPCDAKALRISRDAGTAALLCSESGGPIIGLPSGKVLRTIDVHPPAYDALLAPDGAWLVAIGKDGTISAYPTSGTDGTKTWSVGRVPATYLFLANGMLLIDRTLWDAANTRALHCFDADFDAINGVGLNGTRIATAGADTTVRAYDSTGWKPLYVNRLMLMEPFGIAFTNDGTRLVVGGADYRVSVLDSVSGRTLKSSSPFKDYVNDIVPLAAKDWVAVQFADSRSAEPSYWRLLNIESGETRDVCGKSALVRFKAQDALCFTQDKRTLKIESEPLPQR